MTIDRYPLVHIGYHKTGTTWLQQHVFTNSALGFTSPVAITTMMERLVAPCARL